MNVGSFAQKDLIRRSLSYAAATMARVEPFCLRVWASLNHNVIEGVLLPKKFLAVSLERGCVSVACGERFLNRSYLKGSKRYIFEEGSYVAPGSLVTTVNLAMEELHCEGSQVLLGIPREWAVMRSVELPSVVKENLGNVVAYEIDRLTPLNTDDVMYDFFISGEKDNRLTISLMAVRKGLLGPYVSALAEKGPAPSRILTPLAGMAKLCNDLINDGGSMLLHVGTHGFEGGFIEKGSITGTFYGSFDPSGDGRDHNGLHEEIMSVLEQQNGKGKPSLVCLLSENGGARAMEASLGTAVREVKESDIISLFRSKEKSVPFAPACMLYETLSNGARGFNLAAGGTGKKKGPLITTLVLTVILIAMMVPYIVVPLEMEKRKISEIEHQIKIRKKDVRGVETLKKDIDIIQSEIDQIDKFKRSRSMSINVLKELTSLLPKTVWLTRTRITEETVEIEGYASSATSVLTLLEQSDLFKKVEFASPTVKDTRLNSDRFVIRMEIERVEKQTDIKEGTEKKDDAKK